MMLDDIFFLFFTILYFTIFLVLCVSNLYVKLSVLPFWPGLPGRRKLYLNGTIPGKIKEIIIHIHYCSKVWSRYVFERSTEIQLKQLYYEILLQFICSILIYFNNYY